MADGDILHAYLLWQDIVLRTIRCGGLTISTMTTRTTASQKTMIISVTRNSPIHHMTARTRERAFSGQILDAIGFDGNRVCFGAIDMAEMAPIVGLGIGGTQGWVLFLEVVSTEFLALETGTTELVVMEGAVSMTWA
jgi:hypothetical protein